MNKIFVQIACYRDPEIVPTIEDLISNSDNPDRLTFGICNQYHEEDTWSLDKWRNDDRFTIKDVIWNESKGLCWARSEIQKMYKNEKWTLQIDSHHRFDKGWDTQLIEMANQVDSRKPIITSYAGMYSPKENKKLGDHPFKMVGKRFTPQGTILFYPEHIKNYKELTQPIPARFVSGHFFFTLGIHCKEYKYDPNLYFAGDEISLSIRSWTLGYDIFHPHKTVIWHEYTREGRVKHWDDFVKSNQDKIDKNWHDMDSISKKRLRKMLREEENDSDITGYDLGNVRSHKEYEIFAGIDFKNRILHPDTKKGSQPPTTVANFDSWRSEIEKERTHKVDWSDSWKEIRKGVNCTCKFDFIHFGFQDENNALLHREDISDKTITNGKVKSKEFNFYSVKEPKYLIVWGHSEEEGWKNKVEIPLS